MGTSTTGASRRFSALALLAVAIGFAATLLVGQVLFFDSSASAAKPGRNCDPDPALCVFDRQ
jgi:hypothetical protein